MSIIFDKPANSAIYNQIIKILDNLTGIKWGFVKSKHRVKYLSSNEVPITIGILWGKPYEKRCKPLDISINCKTPSMFPTNDEWVDAVTAELQIGLLKFVKDNSILEKIKSLNMSGDYAELVIEAEIQNKKYKKYDPEDGIYDIWVDNALEAS